MAPIESTVGFRELSPLQQQMVRDVLQSVLDSPHFSKSKRYPAVLEFAVLHTLDGKLDALKERVLGAEIFGRAADYDTTIDPVVRIAAVEVRKRLESYFNENPEAPVRIDLPLGSYRAGFHFRSPSGNSASPEELQTAARGCLDQAASDSTHSPSIIQNQRRRFAMRADVLVALLLLVSASWATWSYVHKSNRGKRDLWWPVLHNDGKALVVVGGGADRVQTESMTPDTTGKPLMHLGLGNAIATGQICGIFREYGRDCAITPAQSATLADLHDKSVVLVGALDNEWTQRLLSPLRYQFQVDTSTPAAPSKARMVVDQFHAGEISPWKSGPNDPLQELGKDYAIVARFHSEITDSMVVVVAGLGPPGTSTAGMYVCSLEKMHEILSLAPKDWKGTNFEAVLQIDVVQGNAGHVKLLATHFW